MLRVPKPRGRPRKDPASPPARTLPERTERTPRTPQTLRAVAPDAARSAASTGWASIDSEAGRHPSSLGSGRHATWQTGQAAQGAARSPPQPGAGLSHAGVLQLGSSWSDDVVLGSNEGGSMLEAVGRSAATGDAASGSSGAHTAVGNTPRRMVRPLSTSGTRSDLVSPRLAARAAALSVQGDARSAAGSSVPLDDVEWRKLRAKKREELCVCYHLEPRLPVDALAHTARMDRALWCAARRATIASGGAGSRHTSAP